MKKNKILLLLSSLTLIFGAFYLSVSSSDIFKKDPVAVEAWDINVKPSVETSYYSSATGKTGSTLKNALASFNKPTNPSYDWSRYEAEDEAQDDSSSILCIYTRHNIPKSGHVGSYSWNTWNKEHVYTQSAFPKSKTDNHNIFACEGQINNYRGNLKFAEVKDKGGERQVVFGHVTDCYKTSTYFEPCDEAKGEIARACLYCTVYYGYDLTQIFDSEATALKWNAQFTVTPREIYRNNVVHNLQGNRNPFVDHPSYAQAIYGGPAYQGSDPLSDVGVTISPSSASVVKGNSITLTAVASDSSAITWTTSNSSIATVSQTGLVTGVKVGTATITATSSTVGSATATITVTEQKTLSSIDISGQKTSFTVGDSYSFGGKVTAYYTDSTTADVTSNSSFAGYDMSTVGNQTVTVSYTEGSVTKTVTYQITVNASGGGGSGDISDYTISSTPLSSSDITSGMKVVWGTSPSKLATRIENNWVYLSENSDEWIMFTLEGSLSGFTLKNENNYVYCSSAKKVAFSGTNSTTFTLRADKLVTSSNSGTFYFNGTGLRPYTSGSYDEAYLYALIPNKTLVEFDIESLPKTEYIAGECFDPTGLSIARYFDDDSHDVYSFDDHISDFSFTPSLTTPLTTSDEYIEVAYGGLSCFIDIEVVSSVTLDSISVKDYIDEFDVGDSFSFGGTVTAHYSDASTSDVTSDATFSGYDMSISGNQTVTVTYEDKTTTYQITVNQIEPVGDYSLTKGSPYINGIAYKMYLTSTYSGKEGNWYFVGSMNGFYGKTTNSESSALISKVYFEESGNGQNIYFYLGNEETSSNKRYFSVNVSGTHYNFTYETNLTAPETKWIYRNIGEHSCLTYDIGGVPYTFGTSGKYTTFGALSFAEHSGDYLVQFATFEGEGSKSFAPLMNSYIKCDSSGGSVPTYSGYSWDLFDKVYSNFCSSDKDAYKNASASQSGTSIQQFVARYDYIVGKYGYTNFLNRIVSSISGRANYNDIVSGENSSLIIIIAITSFTLLMTTLLVIKKKKR